LFSGIFLSLNHRVTVTNALIYLKFYIMKLPKFLLADNSEFPEDLFVVHTEYPRFILNVEEEDVEWLDDLEGDDEETVANEATKVVEEAFKWCDEELAKYDDEEDEE